MKPPYYNTLLEALSRKDRSGLPSPDANVEAETIRTICLKTSDYKDQNRRQWADFVTKNPSDKAAKFMRDSVV